MQTTGNLEFELNTVIIEENTTGQETDDVVFINSQINNNVDVVYTLPPASSCKKSIRVICAGAESHAKVTPSGNDAIVGTPDYPPFLMGVVGDFGVFVSDGVSKWYLNEFRIL